MGNITINLSLEDIEKLLTDNNQIKVEILNQVIDTFAKDHLTNKLNEDIRRNIGSIVSRIFKNALTEPDQINTSNIAIEDYKLIQEKIKNIVDKKINDMLEVIIVNQMKKIETSIDQIVKQCIKIYVDEQLSPIYQKLGKMTVMDLLNLLNKGG